MSVPAQTAARLAGAGVRLAASGIGVRRSGRMLVDDVSLAVAAGELVGLIGPNGAGKSTLLGVLAGLTAPSAGTVRLDGRELGGFGRAERARAIGWLEQGGGVHWPLAVERLVALGRLPHLQRWARPGPSDAAAVTRALALTDCTALAARDATTLSGGERARVLLARALAAEPSVLLADEPIASLDPGHQLQTMEVLRDYARGERAAIVVLHDLSLAARWCDRLCLLHEGRLVDAGTPARVLEAANLARVYGIEALSGRGGPPGEEIPFVVAARRLPAAAPGNR